MSKQLVVSGIIQSGKIQHLVFDPSLLRTLRKSGEVLKAKTPPVVGRVSYKPPRWYRGTALENQSVN